MALAVLALPDAGWAKARPHHKVHHYSLVDRSASYADIVMDAETGRILHATNPDSLRHPASLTKMMTLYMAFQAINTGRLSLDDYMPISSNAAEQPPSKLGLRPGQRIRVEDDILGLVTESANDAAVVMAEYLGGTDRNFGAMMTRQARALGMTHSRFDNPSGLPDPDQVTTARDMAILGHALIYHFPQFYSYFSRDSFTYAGLYHHNHNHLMDRYDGMDGIKTGYIRASGFNLVASAKQGGTRLIGVVFGGHSATARDNQMAQLLDQAFTDDRDDRPQARVAMVKLAPMPQGDADNTDDTPNYVTLPARSAGPVHSVQAMNVAPVLNRDAPVTAPKAPANTGNKWGIQIGAYGDPALGRQAIAGIVSMLPQILGDADPVVQKVSSGGVVLYRARLMSMDEKTAQLTCTYLIQHEQSCLVVSH